MKQQVLAKIKAHLTQLSFPIPESCEVDLPRSKEHGDLATNVAMILAKPLRQKPLDIAEKLAASLRQENTFFAKVEVKAPGFINFFFQPEVYHQALRAMWQQNNLRLPDLGQGKRILIEFVSANPTGPMHVGHGRNAVVGDALARLFKAVGYHVTKEFYINDHGVQIQTLGRSGIHYHQVLSETAGDATLPEGVYQGEYVQTLAKKKEKELGALLHDPMAAGKVLGLELLQTIQDELARLRVFFDHYFSESSLYETGAIQEALATLAKNGLTETKDGALWFQTTRFGDDKDRVLIKNDGSYTYFTPDIAYHYNKLQRGFDLYLNVMGADHGGYVQRLKAAVEALGFDPKKLEVLLMQLVSLKRGDQIVAMSKRTGDYVTLEEVLDEVGADAARFFFLMRSHHMKLEFDLELAKQKTMDNPVYYVQYAHARLCSIFNKGVQAGLPAESELKEENLATLTLPEELELVALLLQFNEVLKTAVELREVHRVVFYLMELAKLFQNYYSRAKTDPRYRVIDAPREAALAKLYLIKTLRSVFCRGLEILGIFAPEQM